MRSPLLPLLALTAATASSPDPSGAATLPPIKFEKYQLANGLEVILHENHSTPIVTTNLWYHVGSKNEKRGRTGFAHLFEHMMFQGSKHWNEDYFKPLQEAGGSVNGSTNTDRTNYYEVVPANFLELALYLEADRMGFLLDAMTQERLDNQRDVVKNERRQNYENVPYGTAREILAEAAWPAGHPYSWMTIGSMEDLSAASLEDVKDFFRRFYTPNNATLCVAGDFQPAEAKLLIEKYFGALPPGPPVWRFQTWVPKLDGEKRVVVQDRVQLPRVTILWHTVPIFAPGDAALDVLGSVLSDGKASRLYQSLVHQKQIAQDVSARQDSRELGGAFTVSATARPGIDIATLERELLAELERMRNEPPTEAEVDRVKNGIEADYIRSLNSVGGFNSVSDRLNLYNHYLGDPGWFQKDLDRYTAITRGDVMQAARRHLGPDRVVMTVLPMPRYAAADSKIATEVDRSKLPGPGPVPSFRLPQPQRATLANGLKLLVVEKHELPVVEMNLVIGAGSAADPATAPGLANLTAQMLDEGTTTRTSVAIAEALDAIGARLSLYADTDASGATLSAITRQSEAAIAILADVVMQPSFPADELERVRKQLLTTLLQEKDSANAIATRTVNRVLFGETHPYGHDQLGTEASLKAATTADLGAFWKAHWRPDNATLILVGDLSLASARALAERALGAWEKGAPAPAVAIPAADPTKERRIYLVDRPGAAQSAMRIAQVGLPRSTPDYFPAVVMNAAFGGMFMSRLNMNLRENKGYTYGARSGFEFRKAPGPFVSAAGVQSKVTRESVAETLKELGELRGSRALDARELEFAKNYIVRSFAQRFETAAQIAEQMGTVVVHGLPDDYYATYMDRVQAVTLAEANRVASEHLRPDSSAVVIVGDAAVIKAGLEELKIGPVVQMDADGRVLP